METKEQTHSAQHLALEPTHEALGALWVERDGWRLPLHYGEVAAEHQAVRDSVGMVDASARLLLRAVGSDRVEFLHGLTTNHIKEMKPGEGTYNATLTGKGKMVGELIVYALADHLILDVTAACATAVQDSLNYYHFSEEVEFADITSQLVIVGLHGPGAAALLERSSTLGVADLPDYHFRRGNVGDVPIMAARVNRTGEDGFELHGPAGEAEALWTALASQGAVPIGLEAMEALRIEAGIPRFGADMDENVIPWEAGIDHAIHLNKGCYVGQEVIARMEYLGRVARKLVALLIEGETAPAPGAEVRAGEKPVGRVTSACVGPSVGQPVALAYVKHDASEVGTALYVAADGQRLPATVAPTPLAGRTPPPKGARG